MEDWTDEATAQGILAASESRTRQGINFFPRVSKRNYDLYFDLSPERLTSDFWPLELQMNKSVLF